MGDYSMFMDPIDDIDCKKKKTKQGAFSLSLSLSYPEFTLMHEPVTLLERCNKKIT